VYPPLSDCYSERVVDVGRQVSDPKMLRDSSFPHAPDDDRTVEPPPVGGQRWMAPPRTKVKHQRLLY